MAYPNEIEMVDASGSHKRTTPEADKTTQKKSKGATTAITLFIDSIQYEFWYGFPTLEILAYEAGMPPLITKALIHALVAQGYNAKKADELTKAWISIPRVRRKLWPTSRLDVIEGEHFNFTQIPFDIEVNMNTQLALDYHILLHFEKPIEPLNQKQV